MNSTLLDLRFAARSIRRRPSFALVAIVTIGLAIGAATSIFSVVDGVLFRSLPYRDAGKLVAVWQTIPSWRKEPMLAAQWDHVVMSYPAFRMWRSEQKALSAVGAWTGGSVMLVTGNIPELVPITRASPSLFDALGVRAIRGRTFLPGEDVAGGPRVALVSYEAWQSRFGARPDVVGSMIRFDTTAYQIIGVLPRGFALVRGRAPSAFFVPAGQDASDNDDNLESRVRT